MSNALTFSLYYAPAKHGDGHKVFIGGDGRVYLADWSGRTPSQTDDGPLYVDSNRPIKIALRDDAVQFVVPVMGRSSSDVFWTWTTRATAMAVQSAMEGKMKFHVPENIRDLVRIISNAALNGKLVP